MPEDCLLRKDLETNKKGSIGPINGVKFEMNIPIEFPMKPPFIRVVFPQIAGGYTWSTGAICFEALTESGWISTMSLVALANALVAFLNDKDNPVRLVSVGDGKTIPAYNREAALREGRQINQAHQGSWGNNRKDMKS